MLLVCLGRAAFTLVFIDILGRFAKLRFSRDLQAPGQFRRHTKRFEAAQSFPPQEEGKMATVAKAAPQPVPRIAPREDLNPFRIAQIQFDIAAEYLKLDQGLRQILRTPKRVLEVSIPTKMDHGTGKVFTGYRVQHNVARGPAKGGLRDPPGGTGHVVKAVANRMTRENGG